MLANNSLMCFSTNINPNVQHCVIIPMGQNNCSSAIAASDFAHWTKMRLQVC
jgi:hypothetical protein